MEPRPQRSRQTPGQGQHHAAAQASRQPQPPQGYQGGPSDGYPDDFEEQTYIAPPRTEYDYSPLDLAPPGQRRRRQFVAAAIGGLTVLLLVAVGVLAVLLFRDDDDDPETNLEAAQSELNNAQATIDAQSTILANAAATETATLAVAGEDEGATEESTATGESAGSESPEESANTPESPGEEGEADQSTGEATEESVAGAGEDDQSGGAGPSVADLEALLPGTDMIPAALDSPEDSNLDLAAVVVALGGSRTVEQNLERWGWSGNVGRTWSATDPAAVEPGAATNISVSIHGFTDAASAAEAFTFYSDVLAATEGYEEGEAPQLGEAARLLTFTDESGGMVVALYVQQNNVLYRFGGYAPPGSDPSADVEALAVATLPARE